MSSSDVIELREGAGHHMEQCHLLPCRIENDEPIVKAEQYFWPLIKPLKIGGDEDEGREIKHSVEQESKNAHNNSPTLTASFRGRPLQGRKVELPVGYKGFVVPKKNQSNNRYKNGEFSEFSYWNWDQLPSDDDPVVKALQWINISNAIHRPVVD